MNTVSKKTSKDKKEIEERKKRDEEKCAEVFADFVASFEDSRVKGKTFVRGNIINPETKAEIKSDDAGRLYKPMAKISEKVLEEKLKAESSPKLEQKKKGKEKEKKKSNLELFKEELKRNQQERELRHRIKKGDFTDIPKDVLTSLPPTFLAPVKDDPYGSGSHDTGDPNTTNIYIGNISPKMNEEMLMKLFGKYGPLASVKIMWPRTEEEKSRNRNCGFVAYMRRKDGDKAIKDLGGKDIMGFEMKLGWGKAVPLPPHPIYVPPEMEEDNTPPPQSGLPFNCQPDKNAPTNSSDDKDSIDPNGFNRETIANAVVKVVIPKERNLLCVIHRVVEFVVREGPMFEAMLMNREINNHMFRFLFDNQSPEHIYYRWKLFSILQGDSQTKWKTHKFKMFIGGSWWQPPPCHQYTPGASYIAAAAAVTVKPTEIERQPELPAPSLAPPQPIKEREPPPTSSSKDRKTLLSSRQRDKLEDMLRNLTAERAKIGDAMVWCLEHADAADEVTECISESLSLLETPLQVKIARLYLVNDILHNCSVKIPNVSYFRKGFETRLNEIFVNLNLSFKAIKARMKAEQFRKQVSRCLSAWMDWAIYPPDFLVNLQAIFLGQPGSNTGLFGVDPSPHTDGKPIGDVDGTPLNLDGVPLKGEELDGVPLSDNALDGTPLAEEDIDGLPMDTKAREDLGIHIASKWDKPEWEEMGRTEEAPDSSTDHDQQYMEEIMRHGESSSDKTSRSAELDESRRRKLREVELKVAEYAQKLEAKGSRKGSKSSRDIQEQCNQYRAKLLEAIEPKSKKSRRSRSRSRSPRKRRHDKVGSKSRSPSPGQLDLSSSQVLQSLKGYDSGSPSSSSSRPRRSRSRSRSSSRSRRKSRSRSKSRSPKLQRKRRSRSRSRSGSPKRTSKKRRSRSRSRSPSKKKSRRRKK